ncbi:hypothetical protein T552_02360 [Pneumocystis carinii B80]|uniref:Myb-like domain-containing protein n=1 Tax=Pneumocystis carinii (strain B80) TaxID=1408658 RepID=A0A0W4ZG77_PNEC8|nr:hypothetical protein T552_02360 [Pneumocystis carinii B80]KTW27381.1 hypothetical protein T552_02360 [Pneumocystis carinii B80]
MIKKLDDFDKELCKNEKKVAISNEVTSNEKKMDGFLRLKGLFRRRSMFRMTVFRKRRLKTRCISEHINPVYLQLLNQTIKEIGEDRDVGIMRNILESSVINGDIWTSLEKERFFKSLSRRSRHNPEDIARDIGSKSVMQVIGYMNILDEELRAFRLFGKGNGKEIVNFRNIPAAMEMSDEWINIEEKEAKKIQEFTDKIQERQERLTWGPEWSFLENKKTNEIEIAWDYVNKPFSSIQEPLLKVSPEICFLRPKSFIELSEKLFFNRDIEFSSKEVVLYRTTLMHMYKLARRLTERLVQMAHFIALSRLRAERSSNFHSQYVVRSKDVLVAVDILGISRNSDEYWLNLPRRIEMTVLNETGQKLDFDVIKHKLSKIPLSIIRRRAKGVHPCNKFSGIEDNYIYLEDNSSATSFISDSSQVSNDENTDFDIDELSPMLIDQENVSFNTNDDSSFVALENFDDEQTEEMLMKEEDEFLEALDAKKSAVDERELWKKLSYFYKSKKIDVSLPDF